MRMKMIELAKAYDPKSFENRIYSVWKDSGAFKPAGTKEESYVLTIPPPNVTGILHLGHGLGISIMDAIVR